MCTHCPPRRCDVCGEFPEFDFHVSNGYWEKVTGNKNSEGWSMAAGYWCIGCFVKAARAKALTGRVELAIYV